MFRPFYGDKEKLWKILLLIMRNVLDISFAEFFCNIVQCKSRFIVQFIEKSDISLFHAKVSIELNSHRLR